MADDYSNQPDIEDVMRAAEQELEAKLDALRESALGTAIEPAGSFGEAAEMRPIGEVPLHTVDDLDVEWESDAEWPSAEAADALLRPSVGDAGVSGPTMLDPLDVGPLPAGPGPDAYDPSVYEPVTHGTDWGAEAKEDVLSDEEVAVDAIRSGEPSHDEHDDVVMQSTSFDPEHGYRPTTTLVRSPEDEEFQAQTRVALRQIQQAADMLPQQLSEDVSANLVDVLRSELATPTETLRMLQSQSLAVSDRVEQAVGVGLTEELDRIKRDVAASMRISTNELTQQVHGHLAHMGEQLGTAIEDSQRQLREDVANVERSVTTDIDRSTKGISDQVGRVERGVQSGIERIDQQLDSGMRLVAAQVSEELSVPMAAMQQLQEELPGRFQRIERTVQEESPREELERLMHDVRAWQSEQREFGETLRSDIDSTSSQVRQVQKLTTSGIEELANELRSHGSDALERLDSIGSQLERDRTQRAEDLEMLVDSMARGWKGVYTAVNRLLDRVEGVDARITGFERRLAAFDSLESTFDAALAQVRAELDSGLARMTRRLEELKPVPVVVTVQSPDAQLSRP